MIRKEEYLVRKLERFEVIQGDEREELSTEDFERFFEDLKAKCFELKLSDVQLNGRRYVKITCMKYESRRVRR